MERGRGGLKRLMSSFITGGEDGYVRLCFFDEDYFTMVGEGERES